MKKSLLLYALLTLFALIVTVIGHAEPITGYIKNSVFYGLYTHEKEDYLVYDIGEDVAAVSLVSFGEDVTDAIVGWWEEPSPPFGPQQYISGQFTESYPYSLYLECPNGGETDYFEIRYLGPEESMAETPIPNSLILFGTGLIGLAGFRRKAQFPGKVIYFYLSGF